jgi:transposase InsO family protein
MSRGGNPYDNEKAASFTKTMKYEEVYSATIGLTLITARWKAAMLTLPPSVSRDLAAEITRT